MGFFEAGRRWHEDVVVPKLESEGWLVLDPWPSAKAIFEALPPDASSKQLAGANRAVGMANEEMIRQSTAVLAVLDGSDVDSGTAAEIGYAASLLRPIVGLRTDLRMSGDNPGTAVNLQVAWFVERSGGRVVGTLGEAIQELAELILPVHSRSHSHGP